MRDRLESLAAVLGLVLIAIGALLVERSHGPWHEDVSRGVTVRILEPAAAPIGSAIVLHGLSGNRVVMLQIGQWLVAQGFRAYLVEAPGHGNSAGPFSYTGALKSALEVIDDLQRQHQIDPRTTVLVGHSMGGEMAVRLADYFDAAATVAISPPPLVFPKRMPSNLLVIGAQLDLQPMKDTALELLRLAGGRRVSAGDFLAGRAADHLQLALASHSTLLLDPRVSRAMANWSLRAIDPAHSIAQQIAQRIKDPPGAPLLGETLGLAGLCMLFPFVTTQALRIFGATTSRSGFQEPATGGSFAAGHEPVLQILMGWCAAALISVELSSLSLSPRLIPLYTGGYLALFLAVAGVALCIIFRKNIPAISRAQLCVEYAPIFAVCVLGALMILIAGPWISWQLTDVWMTKARWLCFLPLLAVIFPYMFIEEHMLDRFGGATMRRRLVVFLAMRLLLWLALLAGILVLLNGQVLTAMLAPFFFTVSLGQRFGAEVILRRTASTLSASLFSAILGAWFIAAVFPLI